ncbi:hypothetical protein [Bacillus sp. REN16]|uniref:hypothetical protein n=1 Tax=Bacillus sp. REN16 TaxID=2887296 RepID=UPI001E56710A|nr:hypothetical protein [Bacillus sp. REN16]MCC3358371.1 hypothetical protein [Bacillus sp. REN16]
MEKKPGNQNLPDFKELNDRVIANTSDEPILVIKTNLDPKNATEENPYYNESESEKEEFTSYFEEY